MFKKISVVVALAVIAIFAAPTAANAGYVPDNQGGSKTTQGTPGAPQTVGFTDGAFHDSEPVVVTVVGDPTAALGVLRTGSVSRSYAASAKGAVSFKVIVPTNATSSSVYNVTATGTNSGNIGTRTITVAPADSGSSTGSGKVLPRTGGTVPVALIWGGSGVLLLGIALLLVLGIVRRQRQRA